MGRCLELGSSRKGGLNSTPAVGAVAVWPSSVGHVGYVDTVNSNGTINTEEYNWYTSQYPDGDGAYHTRTDFNWQAAGVQFIHIKDISQSSPPSPPPPPQQPPIGQPGTLQGDFNGDGYTDLAAFYNYGNNNTSLFVWLGNGSGGFSAPVQWWNSGAGNWNWAGTKPFVITNGSGKASIGALYNLGNSDTVLFVFTSTGSSFSSPQVVWNSGSGNLNWNSITAVVPGDFNGDGITDVAFMYDYGNSNTSVFVMTGNGSGGFNAPVSWWNSGVGNWTASSSRLVAGDVNGDGKTDLIAMYDYGDANASVFTFTSTGTSFNSPQQQWNSGPGNFAVANSQLLTGNFTGGSDAGLAVFYTYPNAQGALIVFAPNGSGGLSAPTTWWQSDTGQWDGTRVLPFVGDFNGDGIADVGAVYMFDNSNTSVFTFLSTGSSFDSPADVWNSTSGGWSGSSTLVS